MGNAGWCRSFYLERLKGDGNEAFIRFVKNGGCYLGVCTGAYYASSRILVDVNTPNEIQEDHPLKFFEGLAQRPIIQPHFYNEPKGITCGKIFLSERIFQKKLKKIYHQSIFLTFITMEGLVFSQIIQTVKF